MTAGEGQTGAMPQVLPGSVGRDEELVALEDALRSALSGRGRCAVPVGEPGMGSLGWRATRAAVCQAKHLTWPDCHRWPPVGGQTGKMAQPSRPRSGADFPLAAQG
jgi:hypothetical protein